MPRFRTESVHRFFTLLGNMVFMHAGEEDEGREGEEDEDEGEGEV